MADPATCCELPASAGLTVGASAWPLYVQLVGLGLVMVLTHCAGMCGPLIMSFRFGVHQRWRERRWFGALAQLGAYQGGRILVYASLGAAAGGLAALAGSGLSQVFTAGSKLLGLLVAGAFLVAAFWRLWPWRRAATAGQGAAYPALLRRLGRKLPERPMPRAVLLGMLLAFLPCMIPAWALGLAAASGHPLHGAALMALLVVLTTPALVPFALAPELLPRLSAPAAGRLQTAALLCSGVWLLVIALAANDLLPHAHAHIAGQRIVFW